MAIYECRTCDTEEFSPRRWAMHLGPAARCPYCGTHRLTRLKERDKIDRLERGVLNLLERLAGGKLHHCRFCRVQFFDRRPLLGEPLDDAIPVTNRQGTASSGE